MNAPEGMHPHKLRAIADALDAFDDLARAVAKLVPTAEVPELGEEMQDDLRAWADSLEQQAVAA
jgi:hypothetical protein